MRWAFWRSDREPTPPRALPDDVGLPAHPRPSAAPTAGDLDGDEAGPRTSGTSSATARTEREHTYDVPPAARADLDRTAVAATGPDLDRAVTAVRTGDECAPRADPTALAVAATGALAARLLPLSGVDGATDDEPADELLHAYAELLAGRAARRAGADHDDLLAVAHLAAAAAAVDAAGDPALLLLAGVPAEAQLRAAAHLLAQTADDGAAPLDQLAHEVRALFGPPG